MTAVAVVGDVLEPPAVRRERLKELEGVIAHGWEHVVEVGRALREIRDEGLYLELDEGITFEQYVRSRWSLSKPDAYRKIDSAIIHAVTSPIGDVPILNESVARELAPVLHQGGQEVLAQAWTKVADRYRGQRPPTAREVNKALVEDGYRERVIGPSSGKVNIAIRLGMFGDKLAAADKRLGWFLDHELGGKTLTKRDQKRAAEYADNAEAMAKSLRQLAAGEALR